MDLLSNNEIYLYSEKKSNTFNMCCLLVMNFLALVALILNECGIFTQSKTVVRTSLFDLIVNNSIPFIIFVFNDYILKKKKSILEYPFFKKLIIVISYLTVIDLCVVFSFHTIILIIIPFLLATQYRISKKSFFILAVLTLLLIPIVTYCSFFCGIYDANLLKPLTEEEALDVENRLNIFKNNHKRIFEIFAHYALPKMLCVGAVEFISYTITSRQKEMVDLQAQLNNRINEEMINNSNMQKSIIEDLADVIESRDIETGEHIKRTKKYVQILIEQMQKEDKYKIVLSEEYANNIINAAPLHDIGKIVVSDLILCKPGKLTDEEFEKMKIHTTKGGEIINNILNDLGNDSFLKVAYEIAMHHHEKWNGKGYPYGLSGDDIPLAARIMAIADVFDALVAERVYKKPIPIDEAINIIINESGTHFDPNLVEIFKECIGDFTFVSKEKI